MPGTAAAIAARFYQPKIRLPRGIAGNIHMMITDKIKLRVAEVIQKWIGETTCR